MERQAGDEVDLVRPCVMEDVLCGGLSSEHEVHARRERVQQATDQAEAGGGGVQQQEAFAASWHAVGCFEPCHLVGQGLGAAADHLLPSGRAGAELDQPVRGRGGETLDRLGHESVPLLETLRGNATGVHEELGTRQLVQDMGLGLAQPVVDRDHLRADAPQREHGLQLAEARRHLDGDRAPVTDSDGFEPCGVSGDVGAQQAVRDCVAVAEDRHIVAVPVEQVGDELAHFFQYSLQNSPIGRPTCRCSEAM